MTKEMYIHEKHRNGIGRREGVEGEVAISYP
jgi:hypothetical protein